MNLMRFALLGLCILLASCVSKPPRNVDNLCTIFHQYPRWYKDAEDVERRWKISIPAQMAIIHQESKFDAKARPPRTKLFWIIPWKHKSTAYGYCQALNGTWAHYKKTNGGWLTSRDNFAAGVDFIGWYTNQAHRQAGIARDDVYSMYLAYHEGIGGFKRKTYLQKPWLIQVARKVKLRSEIYRAQLERCDI